MNGNHQDKPGNKLGAIEAKLRQPLSNANRTPPPASPIPEKRDSKSRFDEKSRWDWLLLIGTLLSAFGAIAIPVAIALGTAWFSGQQHQTDIQIAADQQQETILQTYLDNMSTLLLDKGLSSPKPEKAVSEVARERTLTTLRRLDANHNKIVLQFLQEAHLIGIQENAVIDLSNADLSNDDLSGAKLSNIDLSGADLSGAKLSGASLIGTILNGATLSGAILNGAILSDAILNGATLSGADLSSAELSGADLRYANLSKAILNGATLNGTILTGATLTGATLSGAILIGATLSDADLDGAILSSATLSYATLSSADLDGANLDGANLSGVRNLTQLQLGQVSTCKDAILPEGLSGCVQGLEKPMPLTH